MYIEWKADLVKSPAVIVFLLYFESYGSVHEVKLQNRNTLRTPQQNKQKQKKKQKNPLLKTVISSISNIHCILALLESLLSL